MTKRDELQAIAREAANEAARKTLQDLFLTLGVDVTDPKALIALQTDFKQLRDWREAKEAVKKYGLRALVTTVVTSAVATVLVYFGWQAVMK